MWHPGWGDSAESPLAKDAFEMLLSEAACCNMKALSERQRIVVICVAILQHKASCNTQVLFSSREDTEGPVQGFLLLSQHPAKSLLISAWCSKGFGISPAIQQQGRQKGVLFSTRFKSRTGSLTPGYPSKASRDTKRERLTGRVAEEHLHDHHPPSWEWYRESVGQPWGYVLTEKGLSVPTSSHQYPVPPLPGQVGIIA